MTSGESLAELGRRLETAVRALPAAAAAAGAKWEGGQGLEQLLRDAGAALAQGEGVVREAAALVETSPDAIIGVAADGTISRWNPGAEKVFGHGAAEVVGRPFWGLASAGGKEALVQMLERLKDGEQVIRVETALARKDGRRMDVSLNLSAVGAGAGSFGGAVVVVQDITARLNLEAQLWQAHKMESIGILARGIAHNFNNILAVIQGYASLLMMAEDLPAQVTDYARKISQSTDRAAALTRQLLAFSQREELQPEDLDLNEVVESMANMLQPILGEDVTLRVHRGADQPRIRADLGKIEQIVLNLAINARDAMPRGGQLFLSTEEVMVDEEQVRRNPEAVAGRCVVLSVSDSGSGISPEHLPHVFDPFFTTKQVGQGVGLGLSIVYGSMKQHGGWVEIATEAGKGTTVRTFFPALKREPELPLGATPGATLREGTETILVVEDESSLRGPIRSILERQGFQVLEAGSGVEALAVWKQHCPEVDLLLVDVVMPDGMSGPDLADTLCADKPGLKVLFTSGYLPNLAMIHRPLKEGVNFLQKPYPAHKLVDTVRNCLDA